MRRSTEAYTAHALAGLYMILHNTKSHDPSSMLHGFGSGVVGSAVFKVEDS